MRISDWSSYVCSSDLRSSAIPLIPEIYERCPVSLPRRSTRGEHPWIQPSHGPTIARNLFPEGSRLLGLGNVAARVGGVQSRWPGSRKRGSRTSGCCTTSSERRNDEIGSDHV